MKTNMDKDAGLWTCVTMVMKRKRNKLDTNKNDRIWKGNMVFGNR